MPSTAYPTFWTACFMASRSALGAMMMTAVPFSWSAVASSTPGIASKAVFTVFSQWPHIMPSIFMVFSTVVSWTCSTCLCLRFLSWLASRMLNRFSRRALDTTQKLLKLIAAAPNMGFRVRPKVTNRPAARGIPTLL